MHCRNAAGGGYWAGKRFWASCLVCSWAFSVFFSIFSILVYHAIRCNTMPYHGHVIATELEKGFGFLSRLLLSSWHGEEPCFVCTYLNWSRNRPRVFISGGQSVIILQVTIYNRFPHTHNTQNGLGYYPISQTSVWKQTLIKTLNRTQFSDQRMLVWRNDVILRLSKM